MFDLLFLFTFLLPPLSCLNFIWYGFVDSLPNLLHLLTFFFLLFCSMFVLNIGFFMIFQHCVSFFFLLWDLHFIIVYVLSQGYLSVSALYPWCVLWGNCLSSCSTLYFGICSKCFDCLLKILPQWETKLGFYFLTGFHFVSIYFSVKGWGDYFWFCFHDLGGFAAKPNFFIGKPINTYMYVECRYFICTPTVYNCTFMHIHPILINSLLCMKLRSCLC